MTVKRVLICGLVGAFLQSLAFGGADSLFGKWQVAAKDSAGTTWNGILTISKLDTSRFDRQKYNCMSRLDYQFSGTSYSREAPCKYDEASRTLVFRGGISRKFEYSAVVSADDKSLGQGKWTDFRKGGATSTGEWSAIGTPATAASPAVAPLTAGAEEDLAAFSSGALIVTEPEPDAVNHASWLLRGPHSIEQNWAVAASTNQAVVIELAERSLLTQVEFDTGMVTSGAAKRITVEMSDKGPGAGFRKVAEVTLQERGDNQGFPVLPEATGRWLRLVVQDGYGAGLGVNRFRARGRRLTRTPFIDVSGTYSTRDGALRIRQEGSSVTGCYDERGGTMEGGIEGRVMKLKWREKTQEHNEGEAMMVFSSDGQRWAGLFSYKGEDPEEGRFWTGVRRPADNGTCPNWKNGIEDALLKEIEEFGRARVYGINFDSDSDRIREESRPTLDHVVSVLKTRPQWKITIEGHTDSTAGQQHNKELSHRRANAVKSYLERAAINPARLNAVGYGAARPVTTNETALGRAQNRRVELVAQP